MYQPDFPSVPFRLGLYPVVDSVAWIERLLIAGVRTLQLRIKDKRDNEVEEDVVAAIALGRQYAARLFINDYWRLAVKHQAYGVHLGQEDLETTDLSAIREAGLRLGVSTHDDMEIDVALAARPSYIALGHVFPTQTKQMPSAPQGLAQLASHIERLADYPTVAIGGISLARAPAVIATGVGSIAVVSAITQAADWQALATLPSEVFWRLCQGRMGDTQAVGQAAAKSQAAFADGLREALTTWKASVSEVFGASGGTASFAQFCQQWTQPWSAPDAAPQGKTKK